MSDFSQLQYDKLLEHRGPLFAKAGGTRPAVWLLENRESRAVLKDYNVCIGWYARLIAPLLVWREVKALRALAGIVGIPQLLQQVGKRAFVMEYVPAARLARKKRDEWPTPDFTALDLLIEHMHEAGVAHGDLRRSSNILFDAEGQPYLVDFVSHLQRAPAWNFPWNWLFRRLCRADNKAVLKLKLRVAPELLSDQEKASVGHDSWFDRSARAFGQSIRSLSRLLFARGEETHKSD